MLSGEHQWLVRSHAMRITARTAVPGGLSRDSSSWSRASAYASGVARPTRRWRPASDGSGPLLLACVVIGGSIGCLVAKSAGLIAWIGLFPGWWSAW